MEKRVCRLLILDLDNTLWDWFEIWRRSFGAFFSELQHVSGLPADALEAELGAGTDIFGQPCRLSLLAWSYVLRAITRSCGGMAGAQAMIPPAPRTRREAQCCVPLATPMEPPIARIMVPGG